MSGEMNAAGARRLSASIRILVLTHVVVVALCVGVSRHDRLGLHLPVPQAIGQSVMHLVLFAWVVCPIAVLYLVSVHPRPRPFAAVVAEAILLVVQWFALLPMVQ